MNSYYSGLSLREIYEKKCVELQCRKNSAVSRVLPDIPDEFHALTSIDLSRNFLGSKGILPLLEVIRCCKNLLSIDFREQKLDSDAIDAVCRSLRQHPSVVRINLSDNALTMAAGTSLLHLVKANPTVEHIILDNTNLRPSLLMIIQAHLEKNRYKKDVAAERELELQADGKPTAEMSESAPIDQNATQTTAQESRNISAKGPSSTINSTQVSRQRLRKHVTETALMSFSHNVHEVLFDSNPIPVLTQLCEEEHAWFYDIQFSADDETLQRRATKQYSISSWRRIGDIFPSATLFPGEEEHRVVLPRRCPLSFSWIFSCVDAVVSDLESLRGIVLCSASKEHGLYGLRVHVDGDWRYVIVDDFLPVDSKDDLIFANPVDGKYFWPCILEKALAKMHGSYTALDINIDSETQSRRSTQLWVDRDKSSRFVRNIRSLSVAGYDAVSNSERRTNCSRTLSDLSGGVGFVRFLHNEGFRAEEWWQTLLDLHNAGAMIVSLSRRGRLQLPGIETSHVYRVLQVRQMNGVRLLELSSQWAMQQWKGDWSDESPQWGRHHDLDIALRGNKSTYKLGSFWISYNDFIAGFAQSHLCHTFHGFNERVVMGEWDRHTAGGPSFEHNWHLNPHYCLKISHESPFFINLTVPDTRFTPTDIESLAIHIVRSKYYPIRYKPTGEHVIASTNYVATDSLSFEGILQEADDYWIVPSSHTGGVMGKFFLRVFCQSGFVISNEAISRHWNSLTYRETLESSGEYRIGEDNAQVALSFASCKLDQRTVGSLHGNNYDRNESTTAPLVVRVVTPDVSDLALGLFLVHSTMVEQRPSRSVGVLRDESIVALSNFVLGDSVYLEANVHPGGTYTLLVCVNPPGTKVKLEFTAWSALPLPLLTPLPVWEKKTVQASWPQGSGSYYEVTRNPQVEIYPVKLYDTIVVRMQMIECNYADPAIVFFVLANDGRHGEGIKGQIPSERVVARSQYVRHRFVQCEFQLTSSMDSLLVIPCVQPAGTMGECTISVAQESGDVMVRLLSAN